MERSKELPFQLTSYLSDCVLSYIFSKLSMKDLVKTSILSKRWLNQWGSRMDLNFDLPNMFESNTEDLKSFDPWVRGEFVRRVDQFMQHYQGVKIYSLRVDFPLGHEHNDIIDRWVSQAIGKGAERIELLFLNKADTDSDFKTDFLWEQKPYKFPYTLLFERDSIKHLHLQNCLLMPPVEFSGFKKLRTLLLDQLVVEQDLLYCLFSSCFHLEDLTFRDCSLNSDLNIISPTLSHLNIINCCRGLLAPWKIDIVTLNLSSFDYSGDTSISSIKAPQLLKFYLNCYPMPPVEFSGFKKLRTLVLDRLVLEEDLSLCLFSKCFHLEDLTFKDCFFRSDLNIISPTLRHLNIIDCGQSHFLPWKIDIETLNLSSFDYSGDIRIYSIKAPQLLKFFLNATERKEIPYAFALIANLHQLENLAMFLDNSSVSLNSR